MADGTNGSVRRTLSALFEAAYTTAHPSTCLPPHLPRVPDGGRIVIIGAGKGSAAMAVAAIRTAASADVTPVSRRRNFMVSTISPEMGTGRLESRPAL